MIGHMACRVTSPICVGRQEELLVLDEAAERAAGGTASVVLVGGEAGVGKTRLLAEFSARSTVADPLVLHGACISLGGDERLPFAPIAQALRGLIRQLGSEGTNALLDESTSELGRLVPELGRVVDEPGPSRPEWAQTRVFEGLLTLLGRLAELGPVVLIVEDLHWADGSTRDVLDFLARSLGPERVLIVASYRSDELHRRHPLRPWLAEMERLPRVTRLELPRLGPDDVRRQVEAITGQGPDAGLVATIVRRAAGNPFFTEELLAAGATEAGDQLPDSLRDVLLVRVHALSELAQEVIGCAAVVGPTFDHDLLLRACDLDEASVSMALREANAAQLIVVSDADGTYAFRHALLQEAIYDDMLPRDRRRCHARCAEGLAARPVPDGAEGASQLAALAHHATAAHDLPLALRGWVEAARASARVNALSDAAEAYDRALDMWDAVPADDRPAGVDVVQLMYEVSQALLGSGQLSQARQVAGEAVRRFDAAEDPLRAAVLLERYARALWMTGDLTMSIAALEQAAASCGDQPPTAASARVVASLAGTLMLKDLNERSVEVGREAVAMARAAEAPNVEAYAICGLGTALVNRGDCAAGLPLLRQAAAMAHELDIAAVDFHRTYANLSTALHICGQLEEAVAVALEGVRWAKSRGLWRLQGSFLEANAASVLVDLGRWDDARTLLDQRDRPIVEGVSLLNHSVVAGILAVRTGRLADAHALLDPARNAIANLRDAQFTGPIHGGLIELAIAEERFDDAIDLADAGIALMSTTEDQGVRYRVEIHGLALHAAIRGLAPIRARRDSTTERRLRAAIDARIVAIRDAAAQGGGSPDGMGGEILGYAAFAEADYGLAHDGPDPSAWAAAAVIWERLERPWMVARCRLGEAEAILAARRSRVEATAPLRAAMAIARRLGAAPLEAACASLGRLARIDPDTAEAPALGDGDAPADAMGRPAPDTSFGLTDRELEVLRLLAQGLSNRRIGDTLFITESTAGVHVSNILGKLRVASRVEAAAIAVRVGLSD